MLARLDFSLYLARHRSALPELPIARFSGLLFLQRLEERHVPLTIKASRLELIVESEDGDELNSFFAAAQSPRAYLALSRVSSEPQVYCELNDQAHGFRSRTVRFSVEGRTVRFELKKPESFDSKHPIQCVEVELGRDHDAVKVRECLRAIFAES